MMDRQHVVRLLCLLAAATGSCTIPSIQAQTTAVHDTPMVTAIPPTPTFMSIFENPAQISDGKLLLSVEEVDLGCHKIGEPIGIQAKFQNLTNEEIILPRELSTSIDRRGTGGNFTPLIESTNGKPVYTLADFLLIDLSYTSSDVRRHILSNQTISFIVTYEFPNEIVLATPSASQELNPATPKPGQYGLRFVYIEYPRDEPTWSGALSSNQISICLTN
jgi:hypothetical protein